MIGIRGRGMVVCGGRGGEVEEIMAVDNEGRRAAYNARASLYPLVVQIPISRYHYFWNIRLNHLLALFPFPESPDCSDGERNCRTNELSREASTCPIQSCKANNVSSFLNN